MVEDDIDEGAGPTHEPEAHRAKRVKLSKIDSEFSTQSKVDQVTDQPPGTQGEASGCKAELTERVHSADTPLTQHDGASTSNLTDHQQEHTESQRDKSSPTQQDATHPTTDPSASDTDPLKHTGLHAGQHHQETPPSTAPSTSERQPDDGSQASKAGHQEGHAQHQQQQPPVASDSTPAAAVPPTNQADETAAAAAAPPPPGNSDAQNPADAADPASKQGGGAKLEGAPSPALTADGQADGEAKAEGIGEQKLPGGAYTQREEFLQNMEAAGDISFRYVLNNGDPQNMIWLIGLKNIFSKQLPNMPKEYIARLVLDRRHRSVALVRRGGTVIGGITYRVFPPQGLGEIAFCAVTASEQVKGFGTRLMNHTKEYARTIDKLSHFLTYADNNAVGYFLKQGFTREITMDKDRWVGYIKDYDGGTLMECVLHPRVPYTGLPQMLRVQKDALDLRIRNLSQSHHVHPGLAQFSQGQRCQVPIAEIPGVLEAGWQPDKNAAWSYQLLLPDGRKDATPEARQQFMTLVLKELLAHDESWPFREPVSAEDVEDYYDIIRDPTDLSLMQQRLQDSYYLTLDMFAADFRRMIANCKTYNAPDTIYYKAGDKLEQFFHQIFNSRVDHHPIRAQPDA